MSTPLSPPPLFNTTTSSNCTVYELDIAETLLISFTSIIYGVLGLGALALLYYSKWWQMRRKRALRITIIVFCSLSMLLHIPWNILNGLTKLDPSIYIISFVTNRLSINAFFSAFTLLAVQWFMVAHQIRSSPSKWSKARVQKICTVLWVVLNLCLYVSTIIVAAITRGKKDEANIEYTMSVGIILSFEMGLAVLFILYGTIITCLVSRATQGLQQSQTRDKTKMIAISNSVFAGCLLFRAFAFTYRFWTNCYLPWWLFWTTAYYLPEIPPMIFQLYLYWKLARQERAAEAAQNPSGSTSLVYTTSGSYSAKQSLPQRTKPIQTDRTGLLGTSPDESVGSFVQVGSYTNPEWDHIDTGLYISGNPRQSDGSC